MDGEKISVIVPAYNIQNFIEKTVESICNQSYKNLEIILVNDGSTDNTPQLIDNVAQKDGRVKVIHKKNGGVTSARFCGIESATGEWITFVDGDDFIEPDMYEVLMENAVQYNADISHCGYKMVFPSHIDMYYGSGRLIEQDNITGLNDLLKGTLVEPGLWNKIYRKELFNKLLNKNVMDYSIKINEDLLMNYYLFREAKHSVFIDRCYYHYVLRKGSAATSAINENKLKDPLRVLKIIKSEIQNLPYLKDIVDERIISQLISLATLSNSRSKNLIKPYRSNARRELRAMLVPILHGKFSSKQKIMSLWVSIWPASYRFIHYIYSKITGIDKKYDVR